MRLRLHLTTTLTGSLFSAGLGWVLGAVVQLQQAALWPGLVYACFGLLALVLLAWVASISIAPWRRSMVVLLVFYLLAIGVTGGRAVLFSHHGLDPALEGRDVWVTGVVSELPQRNEAGLRFRLDVEMAQLGGAPVVVPPRIDVAWYGGVYPTGTELAGLQRQPEAVSAGERWSLAVRLKAPHGGRNPFGFDYELWLWEQGVQATGYVRAGANDPAPQRLAQTWRHPVAWARQTVRERIFGTVEQRQFAGLIAALVVGDQNAIDRVDWDVFRATGVAHLVSISGLHITMFAWGAALAVGWLWRRSSRCCLWLAAPSAALIGGVVLASLYALFSGWGVPAQRTCLMLATVALLRLTGARWPWPQTWMLVCAVVVAMDPFALLQPGFWLSFVAVGILFATDSGATHAASTGARGLFHLKSRLVALFREQWVITVALAPLTLLLFGQVSLVGLLANAFAIPWVTLVVTPLAMLGVLVPGLWDVAAAAVSLMLGILQWLAVWPWAVLSLARPPVWVGLVGVLGGGLLVARLPWSMRGLGVPLLLPVLLWQAPLPPAGQFELLAPDIGQGNAVLVRTAGHALLFDAGPRYSLESDAGHRVLVPLLQALHTRLDRVVLSHRDTDHVGGAAAVLAMQPQADVLTSVRPDHPLQLLRPLTRCEAGQQWTWDGVDFAVLHPRAQDYETPSKPNALSCVLRISNGAQTALLVGDIEQPQEGRLVADAAALKATVLLVPHHGSKTSSSAEFLDAVRPDFALVQSGYRNRFGHPAATVMERYHERNIVVHDSPHCGASTWHSARADAVECARDTGLRYWHHRVP